MPGQVIGKALQLGYPGSISRSSDFVNVNRPAAGDIPFGAVTVLNPDNTVAAFGASNTANDFLGIAVRVVKQQTDIFSVMGSYHANDAADNCVRGNIAVPFKNAGTPTAGGAVYVRVAEDAAFPGALVGDIEAVADGTNNILLPNLRFTTGMTDAVSGVVEVTVLERRI
jgi:hypothetical protein